MVDETTDNEQVVLCLRWVAALNVHEEFVGLYKVHSISSDSLVAVINPRRACAARVTGCVSCTSCVCAFVCVAIPSGQCKMNI